MGAAGGAIALPISVGGSALAGGLGGSLALTTAAKTGISVTTDALSGAAAATGTQMLS
jgi:hypothetical protein